MSRMRKYEPTPRKRTHNASLGLAPPAEAMRANLAILPKPTPLSE